MNIKQKLDYHYKVFDKSQISPDPLQFLHLFNDERNIEAMGFIASVFAYGNVKQIINFLDRILAIVENKPYEFLLQLDEKKLAQLELLKYRFYTGTDIRNFIKILGNTYKEKYYLKNVFLENYISENRNLKNEVSSFSNYFLERIKRESKGGQLSLGAKFMFPLPELGSACKRMNLFLRWMIRKDELDFGIWNEIPRNKLIIPVDTHVARICRKLRLTRRKNISWKMAEEITSKLLKLDPVDPVKYDFAICHIGMRKMEF
jgi:uncharacterized protein (TIGR02757 family)